MSAARCNRSANASTLAKGRSIAISCRHMAVKSKPRKSSSTARASATRPKRTPQRITDHEEIQRWAEERGAQPACVKGTGRSKNDVGMIRLEFPNAPRRKDEGLKPISWEDWFKQFEENHLALVTTSGRQKSNFNKLVSRDRAA
jgi:hypothetical protein